MSSSHHVTCLYHNSPEIELVCPHFTWRNKDRKTVICKETYNERGIDQKLQSLSLNPGSLTVLHDEWQQNACTQHFSIKCLNSFREFYKTGQRWYTIGIKLTYFTFPALFLFSEYIWTITWIWQANPPKAPLADWVSPRPKYTSAKKC